jgi:hypothetical protein
MSTLKRALKARMRPIANTMRFIVGKDSFGRWVALERHGRGGGLFRTLEDAVHYARAECGGKPGAVRVVRRPLLLAL